MHQEIHLKIVLIPLNKLKVQVNDEQDIDNRVLPKGWYPMLPCHDLYLMSKT